MLIHGVLISFNNNISAPDKASFIIVSFHLVLQFFGVTYF